MNLVDTAIRNVFPGWALKRAGARAALGKFDAALGNVGTRSNWEAANTTRRTFGWTSAQGDANAENVGMAQLRGRSRELEMTAGFAAEANRIVVRNAVGTGVQVTPKQGAGGKRNAEKLETSWIDWSTQGQFDPQELYDWTSFLELVQENLIRDGECLIRRVFPTASMARSMDVPLLLEVLESDYLDQSKTATVNGNRVIQGVEYDKRNQRVAYWMFPEHPGSSLTTSLTFSTSVRVDARNILQVLRPQRAGQARGIPLPAPILVRLKDYDRYVDAQLIRQVISQCFVGFVYDADSTDAPSPIVGPDGETTPGRESFEPGMFEYLPAGKDIKFGVPPQVEGFRDFSEITIREISRGYGISYESLSGDYSHVNFSSGRMGWLEMDREMNRWKRLLVKQVARPIWTWFNEAAALATDLQPLPARFTPTRREMIDPLKEQQALREKYRARFGSLSGILREQGVADPKELIQEIAEDEKMLTELGVSLGDLDANAQPATGSQQSNTSGSGNRSRFAVDDFCRSLGLDRDDLLREIELAKQGRLNGSSTMLPLLAEYLGG